MFTKSTSIDICGKLHRGTVELYRAVDEATSQLNIPYLIVGAMARGRDVDLVAAQLAAFKQGFVIVDEVQE